jgi:hypothetical protein
MDPSISTFDLLFININKYGLLDDRNGERNNNQQHSTACIDSHLQPAHKKDTVQGIFQRWREWRDRMKNLQCTITLPTTL